MDEPKQKADGGSRESFNLLTPAQVEAARQQKGYIQVYTGDGKGKTTAALGLTLRALGRKRRVLLVLFTKGGNHYGCLLAFQQLRSVMASRLTIVQAGLDRIVFNKNQNEQDKIQCQWGWQIAQSAIFSGHYDLVVMDELNIAIDLELVSLEAVKTALAKKPETLELVLTGRRAHPDIVAMADLVSQVDPVKHYWDQGVRAREGIEY